MMSVKISPILAAMIATPGLCSVEEISSLRAARRSSEQQWPSWSRERSSATSRDPGPRVFRSRHQEGKSGTSASLWSHDHWSCHCRQSKTGGNNFTPEANAEASETRLRKDGTTTFASLDDSLESSERLRRNSSLNSALRTRISQFTSNRQASDSSLLNNHPDFLRSVL